MCQTSTGPECASGALILPVSAPSGVSGIALGANHGCVSLSAGGVACWGNNAVGQLGRGVTGGPGQITPAAVSGLGLTVALGAENDTTCAVSSTNAVRCWGAAGGVFLGPGVTQTDVPVLVVGF
jgi:alpha-tubulin suppressor-like RCC1 family protein